MYEICSLGLVNLVGTRKHQKGGSLKEQDSLLPMSVPFHLLETE